jgi:hypothetical protein
MLHSVMVQHQCASACATKDSALKASSKRKAQSGRPRPSCLADEHDNIVHGLPAFGRRPRPGCSFVSFSLDETKSTGGLQTTQSRTVSRFCFDGHGSRAKASGHCVCVFSLWKEEKAGPKA